MARNHPDDWVVRAQDGHAGQVLAETAEVLTTVAEWPVRAQALYARALALHMLGDVAAAVEAARDLTTLCRDHGLAATGLQARALLVDLLRREGRLEEAVEQLAQAVALASDLRDLDDPQVQGALGALGVALRMFGVVDEARRVEARLAMVESSLPRHHRVARWSNLALEHAVAAMSAGRVPPYQVDTEGLSSAVDEIRRAVLLAEGSSYHVVADEEQVLLALREAVDGDPAVALERLETARSVLDRGAEAVTPQLLWAAASMRALTRLGRSEEAVRSGRSLLAKVEGSGIDGDRLVLAYEVMRAEEPGTEHEGSGTAAFVRLAEERVTDDLALLGALFRARVDIMRGADERRVLAQAASLDSLTGLVNRRGAASAIAECAALPPGEDVALLLVDLDGFKEVNDNRGHLAGDRVLQRVAAALRSAARMDDVVARWGGDEFVIIALLDADQAVALADRLRETVRGHAQPGAEDPVTASVGVAVRGRPIEDDGWLRRADEAMYAAKRSGGDATVVG